MSSDKGLLRPGHAFVPPSTDISTSSTNALSGVPAIDLPEFAAEPIKSDTIVGHDALTLLPEVQATGRPAGSRRPFQRRRRSRACDACRTRKTKCDTPDEGPCSACVAASLVCKFSEGEDKRRAGPARRVRILEHTIADLTQKLAEAEEKLHRTTISGFSSVNAGNLQSPTAETDVPGGFQSSDSPSHTSSISPEFPPPPPPPPQRPMPMPNTAYPGRNLPPIQSGTPVGESSGGGCGRGKGRFQSDGTAWDDHIFGPSSGPSFLNSYKEYLSRLGYRPPSSGDPHDSVEGAAGNLSPHASPVDQNNISSIPARFVPLDIRAFLPPLPLATELLEVFRKNIQECTVIFYWPTIEAKFKRAWGAPIWDTDPEAVRSVFCVIIMIMAVASQLVDPRRLRTPDGGDWSTDNERNGWVFFELGKKYSNPNNPSYSIDDAIYLLLMAFYLDKAFLPSPCWMITGAMARVCQDIGLYRRTPAGMFSEIDVESRTRLFWAAYIQDRKISMKQGRPVIFLDKHIDVGLPGEHMGAGVGSGEGENLEAAKKSLQVFRATIRVAQTSESLLNINLKHDGETEDVQLLQSVDEMLKRSWEAYPPDLTDLSESGPIYLPALRPLFHLQHSRVILYRYFTDFSNTLSLTNSFRTFCLGQSIQVSKITAHLLLRASNDPDFDITFGLGSEELVHIHTFRVATILLLGYYCRDRNLPSVSKEEVDICASALTSVAKTNRQAGEKLLGLFKDFALMFGYSVEPNVTSSSASTAVKEGSEAPPPATGPWGSEPPQNALQPSPSLPLLRFGGGFNVYSSTPSEASVQGASASEFPPQVPPGSGAAHPQWLHQTTGAILLQNSSSGGSSGESSESMFIDPQIGSGSAAAGTTGASAGSSLDAEGQIDWNAYQQMMQFDPGFTTYMLGPNDRDFH